MIAELRLQAFKGNESGSEPRLRRAIAVSQVNRLLLRGTLLSRNRVCEARGNGLQRAGFDLDRYMGRGHFFPGTAPWSRATTKAMHNPQFRWEKFASATGQARNDLL